MSLSTHVATLGRGPGRSRSLSQTEAADAMTAMLSGDGAPEAVGALLMLLRMKGETVDEIAGMAEAAQASLPEISGVALDWPSYAAGRTRGLPWFLLAARLVARAGYPVLVHGAHGPNAKVRDHLDAAGLPVARNTDQIGAHLAANGIAYAGLEDIHPALSGLLDLRPVLGLRSCINTICRMLNPGRASASVQGVFHPSYRALQADAAARLGLDALTVIKGGGGEFERHPGKQIQGFGLRAGAPFEVLYKHQQEFGAQRLSETTPGIGLAELWSGQRHDPFAEAIVIGTAALALDTLSVAHAADVAQHLWDSRNKAVAA